VRSNEAAPSKLLSASQGAQDPLLHDSFIHNGSPIHRHTEILMNEDKIKGQWKQLAGKLKTKWGKLTDDDLKISEGNSEYLAGKIQERYGIARDEAHKQVKEFGRSL
jgi:uncharacterized protein YjbJ (UPF0337 family)